MVVAPRFPWPLDELLTENRVVEGLEEEVEVEEEVVEAERS